MVTTFTDEQIAAAIEAEVADWERFFSSGEPATDEEREARRRFHRANVSQGHLGELKRYLGVFPVLTYRLVDALDALKKLAKKAERYGTGRITWTVGQQYTETVIDGMEAPPGR